MQILAHETGDDRSDAGYLLLALVIACAVILIALSVAAPLIAKDLQRDKEVESEHRAEQYVRAIQLYYRKNNSYPPSMKALESTNNVRYLRQQYIDPLTGKNDWRILHLGEQKTTIKSFFGKELQGLPGGGGGSLGSAAGLQSGGGQTTVSSGILGAGFNGATIGSSGASGATGTSGTAGATGSTGGSGVGMFGDSNSVGAIIGVGTSKTGTSILTPNQQTTYETWEFWYDPRVELLKKNVSIFGGGISSQSATGLGGASGSTGSTGTTGSTGIAPIATGGTTLP